MKDLRIFVKIKNNLILQTVEELWGKGISNKEIALKIGIHWVELSSYLNFRTSPISKVNRQGSLKINDIYYWTPTAVKIFKSLNKHGDEIFPEHFRGVKKLEFQLQIDSERLYAEMNRKELDLDKHIELIELRKEVSKILSKLTPKEEKVLRMRFGISEDREYSLERVAIDLGVTTERIRQIEYRALEKIKYLPDIQILRQFN